MRKWALQVLGTIEALSARMTRGEATEKTPFTWSGVRHGIVMAAMGAGIGLLWYEEWLPKGLEAGVFPIFLISFTTAIGLGLALASYLSLRAERLGTARAGMQALVAIIALCIVFFGMFAGFAAFVAWVIGGFYHLAGSEIIDWVTGERERFPYELGYVAMVLAVPLAFHIRDVYSWIGQTKKTGLVFALVVIVAPFAMLQAASAFHLLWQVRPPEGETPVAIWIINIIFDGVNVLVAALLILLIVRAIRRLGRQKTSKTPISQQNSG